MTAKIEFIPSPFDRLDPIARAVRWWTSQMIDILGRPRRQVVAAEALATSKARRHLAIALGETDAFLARLTLPRGPTAAHENAIKLRLADLAPANPEQLEISATATAEADDGAVTYSLAMARSARLEEIERSAKKNGAPSVRFHVEGSLEAELVSPAAKQAAQRWLIIDGTLVVVLIASAVAAVAVWAYRLERSTMGLAGYERDLRRAAVVSEGAQKNAAVTRELVGRGILDRRASAVLSTLAALNRATPDSAWWTSVRWSPQETIISAQAANATSAIETISKGAKGWSVELSGAIGAAPAAGLQAFELKIHPRDQPPKADGPKDAPPKETSR